MAPNEKGDKFLKLAKRAGLSGRSAARLERAVKSAAEMYALDKDFRQGALGKKRMADAQALDGLSELALRVDRALRGRGAYNNFVYALDALSHSAKAALEAQTGITFALSILPLTFAQFAKHAKAAAEKKMAPSAQQKQSGRPRVTESNRRLARHLRRLAREQCPTLANDSNALEKWLGDALKTCGVNVTTKWRLRELTRE